MHGDEAEPGEVGGRLLRIHRRAERPPWVPDPPVSAVRERAQSTAITAYTAVHGHPLDHPEPGAGGRRWGMRARVAVAGSVAVVALAGFVVLRSSQVASVVVGGDAVVDGGGALVDGGGAVVDGAQPENAADDAAEPLVSSGAVPDGADGTSDDGAETTGDEVVVHVVGQVEEPGVVHLPDGARVADAVAAAGGATPGADLSGVNLARLLLDGEQILVPAPGEATSPATPPTAGGGPGPLDLNAADIDDLDDLPGIGPVLAERIVDWRTAHGRFSSVDELAEVSGIGPSVLADLRDLVRV